MRQLAATLLLLVAFAWACDHADRSGSEAAVPTAVQGKVISNVGIMVLGTVDSGVDVLDVAGSVKAMVELHDEP